MSAKFTFVCTALTVKMADKDVTGYAFCEKLPESLAGNHDFNSFGEFEAWLDGCLKAFQFQYIKADGAAKTCDMDSLSMNRDLEDGYWSHHTVFAFAGSISFELGELHTPQTLQAAGEKAEAEMAEKMAEIEALKAKIAAAKAGTVRTKLLSQATPGNKSKKAK